MSHVSPEKKKLYHLAGKFLVASRLTQRGYRVKFESGIGIGYDILAFDEKGNKAFLEVKSSATYRRRWILQKKYASTGQDEVSSDRRFVCCVDLSREVLQPPDVFVFPAVVVANGLHYYFSSKFPDSSSYHLSLDFKPQGRTKEAEVLTVGEFIDAEYYRENYAALGVKAVAR